MSLQNADCSGATTAVEDALPLVMFHARRIHRRAFRHVEYDDLVQEGCLALLEAQQRYVEGKVPTLANFANQRIRGAMFDYLRRSIPGGRRHGREIALESIEIPLAGAGADVLTLADLLPCDANPEREAMRSEDAQRVSDAAGELPERTQYIFKRLYRDEIRQSDIARELGLCQGRISQIRTAAMAELRNQLA